MISIDERIKSAIAKVWDLEDGQLKQEQVDRVTMEWQSEWLYTWSLYDEIAEEFGVNPDGYEFVPHPCSAHTFPTTVEALITWCKVWLWSNDVSRSELDLRGVDLRGVELSEANLGGAVLRDAKLARTNLSEANLRGADLVGANLGGRTRILNVSFDQGGTTL